MAGPALVGWTVAWAAGRPTIALARRLALLDVADGRLKLQARPVALLGGPLVLLALVAALASAGRLGASHGVLLLAAALSAAFGLLDDIWVLSPATKLAGAVAVALFVVMGHEHLRAQAGPFAALPRLSGDALAVLWIVMAMNAFNLIDVSDGLCAAVACVALSALGIRAWVAGEGEVAAVCAAAAGATAGFLRHNWFPARIYLGDSGSGTLGLLVGVLALQVPWGDQNAAADVIAPLAALGVPLFDLAFVVACRSARGIPPYLGSPDHFAVRLARHGVRADRIAIGAALAGAVCGAGALVSAGDSAPRALCIAGSGIAGCLLVGSWLWRFDPRAPGRSREGA